jgi:hypothetical protein
MEIARERISMVRIDRRFRGPPDSGNGGYFAGVVAKTLGGSDVAVSLRRPAPLDTDLRLEHADDEACLYDGSALLAVAGRKAVTIDVPPPVLVEEARAAEGRFLADRHLYPGCFVCGPDRLAGDGWRIFPGRTGNGHVAATWTAPAEFGDEQGNLPPEFMWAALDCPGYFAVDDAAGLALLGQIGVHQYTAIPVGEPLIVSGWSIGTEGRKHRAGTALHSAEGSLLATAEQIWISLR